MYQVYVDEDQEITIAIYVIDSRVCKKVIAHIKDTFGFELDQVEDTDEFSELGEFTSDTLIISNKDFNEDFINLGGDLGVDIHLHIIP